MSHTHLTLFNPTSITILLERNGFSVLTVETPGLLDVSLLQEAWKSGVQEGSPFLQHMLTKTTSGVAENFQRFLRENALSSHMWVVARKV